MYLILFGAACCWAVLLGYVVVLCQVAKHAGGALDAPADNDRSAPDDPAATVVPLRRRRVQQAHRP
jgi:hypothetical protein